MLIVTGNRKASSAIIAKQGEVAKVPPISRGGIHLKLNLALGWCQMGHWFFCFPENWA
jgi:hypothetical protein